MGSGDSLSSPFGYLVGRILFPLLASSVGFPARIGTSVGNQSSGISGTGIASEGEKRVCLGTSGCLV